MLMQNFKSAADLEITEAQKDALAKTLVLLETGRLPHDRHMYSSREAFCMSYWPDAKDNCGTVACIAGTAERVGNVKFTEPGLGASQKKQRVAPSLRDLFFPPNMEVYSNITPAQAARALRSYLTTGDAKWPEAVAR